MLLDVVMDGDSDIEGFMWSLRVGIGSEGRCVWGARVEMCSWLLSASMQ